MQEHNLEKTTARSLADALALDADDAPLWRPGELAALFRHQLAAPLQLDLGLSTAVPAIVTFSDLFSHPNPPLELLESVKEFAKIAPHRAEGPLPQEIATVLYTLSIVVALNKCGRRISGWEDQELRQRLDWVLAQPWLDESTRRLLRKSRSSLETAVSASGTEETAAVPRPPAMSVMRATALGQLGEYVLLEKLGEGGMGTVYKALHTELDRIVAVKVLRPGQMADEEAVARFRREMKAVGRFDHPNIVRAHDARKIDDRHLLVMEFVDGLDLAALVELIGPLPVADACEIARQAAAGLTCADEHGLVHRDIKPSNLMLTRDGQIKILDLGLARLSSSGSAEMTAVGQIMGTPDYMAPEQFSDTHAADIRSDVYSLGCTLYKMLSGRAPFSDAKHEGMWAKMRAHASERPSPLQQFRGDVPNRLAAVLDRMLAKPPAERFSSPAEVERALSPFATGTDLKALSASATGQGPPPLPCEKPSESKSADTGRRKWRAVVASLAALAVAAVLLGVVLWHFSPNRLDEDHAIHQLATANVPRESEAVITEPLSGRIVLSWARSRLSKPDLWLFSPDGRTRRNITETPRAFEIHPKFSPDGQRIAFIRGAIAKEPNGVWVCNSDGSGQRQVLAARSKSERFASPVWLSNSLICYTRDPKLDRSPDGELWQVDLDGRNSRLMFHFRDVLEKGAGVATDVSPDGRQLAIIAQRGGAWPTADVYVIDPDGTNALPVWIDRPDQYKDARALWSPDGQRIAWCHNFTAGAEPKTSFLGKFIAGANTKTFYCGVGLARLGPEGRWTVRFSPDQNAEITPLAWSPRGDGLLCASLSGTGRSSVAVFLMDDQFRPAPTLFEIDADTWFTMQRDLGRLADWAAD